MHSIFYSCHASLDGELLESGTPNPIWLGNLKRVTLDEDEDRSEWYFYKPKNIRDWQVLTTILQLKQNVCQTRLKM